MDNFLLSFIMMIFWSILFCFLFIAARKIKVLRNHLGISACIVVCVCLYIRMLVPFDIGIFRRINVDWSGFRYAYDLIHKKKIFFNVITLEQFLGFIWIFVALVLLISWFGFYWNIWKAVSVGNTADKEILSVLDKVMTDGHFRIRPEIIVSENLRTPYSIGLLHHRILMPREMYSDDELYYMLFHEMTHFRKGDLWIKMLANIMCRVFWWNPLVYMIRREVEVALEIRCDTGVTAGMEKEDRCTYLETVLKVVKTEDTQMKKRGVKGLFHYTAGFARTSGYDEMMTERFLAVANREKSFGERKTLSVFWVIVMVSLMVFSYMFVITPHYAPDSSQPFQTSLVSADEIEIIKLDDGTYQLCYKANGETITNIVEEEALYRLQESREEMEK